MDVEKAAVKTLLTQYYKRSVSQDRSEQASEVSDRLALDDERGHYLWFRFGWQDRTLVQHVIMYLCIKDGKVWVEQDSTDLCIVDDLVAAGIPAQSIVLGFHHPQKRPLTEFATA
ncbi:MAG: XisI protein [Cyanobacteria bacterium P01_A01_bin.105]